MVTIPELLLAALILSAIIAATLAVAAGHAHWRMHHEKPMPRPAYKHRTEPELFDQHKGQYIESFEE